MAQQPQLSLIIVSYNTKQLLDDCLASVFAGCGNLRCEIFVVDNHSQDGSPEMVRTKYPQVHLIANQHNLGFAAANNQALREATGDFFLLLNSDTLILGNVLTSSLTYMHEHPRTAACGCRVLNYDRSLQPTCFRWPSLFTLFVTATGLGRLPIRPLHNYERMGNFQPHSIGAVDTLTGCFLLLRSEAVKELGLLDEDFFFYGEETDWCRRARVAGWNVEFVPTGEIIHYGGASGCAVSWQRRIMLLGANIRLQRKHNGRLCAGLAFLLLWCGEALRAVAFFLASLLRPQYAASARIHAGTVRHFLQTWPSGKKSFTGSVRKILAVSSSGGHWTDLLSLRRSFEGCKVVYATTCTDYHTFVPGCEFHVIPDASRWSRWGMVTAFWRSLQLVRRIKPDVIITTGALPGFFCLLCGKLTGAKTIWLDSFANTAELSMCGKVAGYVADVWLTPWPHLAAQPGKRGPLYRGKMI